MTEGLPPADLPEMQVLGSVRGIRLEAKGHALFDPDLLRARADGPRVPILHAAVCGPAEMRQVFLDQVLTEPELLARLRNAAVATIGDGGERTYYQTLQVDPAADPEVIEAAFRRLAMKYHPDTSSDPNASLRMREIIEARECLSDPARRLTYDRSIGIVRRTPGLRPEDI